jgi:uncharacterized protein YbcI
VQENRLGIPARRFFFAPFTPPVLGSARKKETKSMNNSQVTMAEQVASAVRRFQHLRTGHAPDSVTVALSEGTLVVTLHGALTPAEKALFRTPEGAAKVREFHRELFQNSLAPLRKEIERITGIAVVEAIGEIQPNTGAIVQIFTTGTMVQVFQLAGGLSAEAWNTIEDAGSGACL